MQTIDFWMIPEENGKLIPPDDINSQRKLIKLPKICCGKTINLVMTGSKKNSSSLTWGALCKHVENYSAIWLNFKPGGSMEIKKQHNRCCL